MTRRRPPDETGDVVLAGDDGLPVLLAEPPVVLETPSLSARVTEPVPVGPDQPGLYIKATEQVDVRLSHWSKLDRIDVHAR